MITGAGWVYHHLLMEVSEVMGIPPNYPKLGQFGECFTDHTLAHPLNCRGGVVARPSAWCCIRVLNPGLTHEECVLSTRPYRPSLDQFGIETHGFGDRHGLRNPLLEVETYRNIEKNQQMEDWTPSFERTSTRVAKFRDWTTSEVDSLYSSICRSSHKQGLNKFCDPRLLFILPFHFSNKRSF